MSHRCINSVVAFTVVVLLISLAVFAGDTARLQSGGKTIGGTVLTVDNAPAVGAVVQLFKERGKTVGGATPIPPGGSPTGDVVVGAPDPIELQNDGRKPFKDTLADSAGKFTFGAIPPGKYTVVAGTGRNIAKATVVVDDKSDPAPLSLKLPSK